MRAHENLQSNPHPVRLIEFFGLPGAGKSTLAVGLARTLKASGVDVVSSAAMTASGRSFPQRLFRRLALVCRAYPILVLQLRSTRLVLGLKQATVRDAIKSIWNFWTVLSVSRVHGSRPGPVMIVDEGLLQAIWSAHMGQTGAGEIAQWHDLAEAAGLLETCFVIVDTNSTIARRRLTQRKAKTSRMQAKERLHDAELWNRGQRTKTEIVSYLRDWLARAGLKDRVIVVDAGETDPAELVRSIRTFLHQHGL